MAKPRMRGRQKSWLRKAALKEVAVDEPFREGEHGLYD